MNKPYWNNQFFGKAKKICVSGGQNAGMAERKSSYSTNTFCVKLSLRPEILTK
jgi:hypothetical protein